MKKTWDNMFESELWYAGLEPCEFITKNMKSVNKSNIVLDVGWTAVVDCVSAGVCLARGDSRPLYNSSIEGQAADLDDVCGLDIDARPVFLSHHIR